MAATGLKPSLMASCSLSPVRATSISQTLVMAVPTTPGKVAYPPPMLIPATRPALLATVPSAM